MTIKLDGKRVAAEVKANLAERVSTLKEHGIVPGLGTLLVGEDPGSMKYVAGKHADCAEVGIRSIRRDLPADASFDDIAAAVRVIELLDAYDIDLNGKEVCVLGRGITIGRTIGLLLTRKAVNATVTLCHTGTRDIADHMRRADVIVAAMGSAGFVKPENVKDGAVLMDVGVSRVFDEQAGRFRIRGDVDKACYDKVSAYSPNPGGVGPMTRAMLLANVVEMAERKM